MDRSFATFFALCGLLCLTGGIVIILAVKQAPSVSDGAWFVRGGLSLLFGALFWRMAISAWRRTTNRRAL